MFKYFILFFSVLLPFTSRANEPSCSRNGTKIIYINGMFNLNPPHTAQREIKKIYNGKETRIDKGGKLSVSFVHNRSNLAGDFVEVFNSKLQEKFGFDLKDSWKMTAVFLLSRGRIDLKRLQEFGIKNNKEEQEIFDQLTEVKLGFIRTTPLPIDVDTVKLKNAVVGSIGGSNGQKVILIGHSQGNFIANQVVEDLSKPGKILNFETEKGRLFGNIHLASPVQSILAPYNASIKVSSDNVVWPSLGQGSTHTILEGGNYDNHSVVGTYLAGDVIAWKLGSTFNPKSMAEHFFDELEIVAKKLGPNCCIADNGEPEPGNTFFVPHPNGGGLVSDLAVVSPESYIAEDTMICNGVNILGKSKIGASSISGNTTISSALISNSSIHGNSSGGVNISGSFTEEPGEGKEQYSLRVEGANIKGNISMSNNLNITRGISSKVLIEATGIPGVSIIGLEGDEETNISGDIKLISSSLDGVKEIFGSGIIITNSDLSGYETYVGANVEITDSTIDKCGLSSYAKTTKISNGSKLKGHTSAGSSVFTQAAFGSLATMCRVVDSVVSNSTITNSSVHLMNIDNAIVSRSIVGVGSINNSSVKGSRSIASYVSGSSSVINSDIDIVTMSGDSNVNDSIVKGSTLSGSVVEEESNVFESILTNTTVILESLVEGSELTDSNILAKSTVRGSMLTLVDVGNESQINNSIVSESTVTNLGSISNSQVVILATVDAASVDQVLMDTATVESGSVVIGGQLQNSTVSNFSLVQSTNVTDSTITSLSTVTNSFVNKNVTNSLIANSTINATVSGSIVSDITVSDSLTGKECDGVNDEDDEDPCVSGLDDPSRIGEGSTPPSVPEGA